MQDTKRVHANEDDPMKDREAEATTDETLTDLEDQQQVGEDTDNNEIVSPDAEPNQPARHNDQDLM
jgi:hypothetical protein